MKDEYGKLKASWDGYPGYDRFFAQDLGNAHFASIATYTQLVPAFEVLLAREDNNLPRFYAEVKALAALPKAERDAKLGIAAPSRSSGMPAPQGILQSVPRTRSAPLKSISRRAVAAFSWKATASGSMSRLGTGATAKWW
jgi:hypothetical protein